MNQTDVSKFAQENLKTIFAYALSRVSNKDDAEDLTGDIVLAILQSADRIKNQDAFYGYVWRIAANTYKKFLQKRSRYQFEEIGENESDEEDFTEDIFAQEEINSLRREIALLSKEYRECTVAYYYDELSCAEVSNKLDISLEMVKYYLFKTRKILKEGISMEREFGEKSFRPAPFEFATIFTEKYNPEYQNLFARKLPGQILLATYYTPMTVREIAIELGVASVYLEDEIALLEKYNLMMALPKGKYLSNLVIFTDGFTNEFHRMAERFATSVLAEIVSGMREKLKQIREVNAVCKNLSNDRLLWGLLWPVMRQGSEKMAKSYPQYQTKHEIYNGATGTNYGTESDNIEGDFSCNAFAGHVGIDENYFASAADFGILPEKNRYFGDLDREIFRTKIYKTISGEMEPEFIILTEEEERTISEILTEEITLMAKLYDKLFFTACQLMHVHAPKNVENQIDRIVFQTLFFRTVGLIGGCAVKCEALTLPDFDGPAAVYVRKIAK